MEEEPPPLSALMARARNWWQLVRWPLVAVAMNAIVIVSLVVTDEELVMYGDVDRAFLVIAFRRSNIVLAALCAVDSFILWRAVRLVEQQVHDLNNDEDTSSHTHTTTSAEDSMGTFLYARLSKRWDIFLGLHSPTTTTLVNILYALLVGVATVFVVSVLILVYLLNEQASQCIVDEEMDPGTRNLTGVPNELQQWASDSDYDSRLLVVNKKIVYKKKPYSLLNDGSLWLTGPNPIMSSNYSSRGWRDISGLPEAPILLHMPSGASSLEAFPEARDPSYFMEFPDESSNGMTTFCCLSGKNDYRERDFLYGVRPQLSNMVVLCCKNDISSCRNTTFFPVGSHMNEDYGLFKAVPWNGLVWMRIVDYSKPFDTTIVASLDPKTMVVTEVHSSSDQSSRKSLLIGKRQACSKWLVWGLVLPGATFLVVSSFWLLKIRDVPVGISSLVVATYALLSSIDLDFGYYTGLLLSLAAAMTLFTSPPSWMTRDMNLWGFYTLLVSLASPLDDESVFPPLVIMIVVGVALNHPVLQVLGQASMIGVLVAGPFFFVGYYSFVQDYLFGMLPIGLLVSCGLISAGGVIQRYRAYFMWYIRRALVALNRPHRESSMTDSLLGEGERRV